MKPSLRLFFATLLVYTLTAGGHLYSPDEEVLFRATRSLAQGHGGAVEPLGPDGFASRPAQPARADGREYPQYGIGQPLLALPFYWIGAGLAELGDSGLWRWLYGAPVPSERGGASDAPAELAPRWACSWFNSLAGAALAALLCLTVIELTGSRRIGLLTGALYAFGSLAWPHSRPFFTETLATFFILLAFYWLLRALRPSAAETPPDQTRRAILGGCAAAGAAAGYAALVRMDSVLAYPGLAVFLLTPMMRRARAAGLPWIWTWVAFALPALAWGAILLGLNLLRFGGLFELGYADQTEGVVFSTPVLAGLFGFLFSPGKGLFFFSPVLVLGFAGWGRLWRLPDPRGRGVTLAVALLVLVPLLVHAKWQNWPGGWCWGPRHIFGIHVFLALPIAAWLAGGAGLAGRIGLPVVFVCGIGVQLFGVSQNFIAFHQRFFRAPGEPAAFFVQYDPYDQAYWANHYQLLYRPAPEAAYRPVPLMPPAPIQHSIYLPQASVWAGYPVMLREGSLDNFWVRLMCRRGTDAP